VHRPADAEPRLVGYAVGDRTREDLMAGLRATLPAHLLPSDVVILDALPLTPTAKLDRAALPPPRERTGSGGQPTDPVERRLAALWREVLRGRSVPGRDDDFFAAGGDSLSAVRLVARVEAEFGRSLPLASLLATPTVAGISALLREDRYGPRGSCVELAAGAAPTIVLVHGAGGGILPFVPIGRLLGPGRRVLALQSPAIDEPGVATPSTVETVADGYAAELNARLSGEDCVLVGWSTGAYVAVELARRLSGPVQHVVLLDPPPADAWRDLDSATTDGMLGAFVQDLQHALFGAADPVPPDTFDVEATFTRLYARMRAARLVPDGGDPTWLRRMYEVFRANLDAADRHRPGPLNQHITLILAAERWQWPADRVGTSWREALLSPVSLVEVAGNHYSILRSPCDAEVAAILREIARVPSTPLASLKNAR
jgi:thioesterase domain-containing protein/acyl carrier protein